MTRAAVENAYDVSRETSERLERYAELLSDWQQRINLVGPSTLPQIWQRHFADSLQLLALAPPGRTWLDIGSGAGFPGLVIAVADPEAHVTLVESIGKKCRFLQLVSESLGVADRVSIENRRAETVPPRKFDIVTARALAPLHQLFDWGLAFAGPMTRWLLPKGARVTDEIDTATRHFNFRHELVQSRTDPSGRVVVASHVERR